MRHLVRLVWERHDLVDDRLARLVDIDPEEVWKRIDVEPGDLSDIGSAASRVAAVDSDASVRERALVTEINERCRRE